MSETDPTRPDGVEEEEYETGDDAAIGRAFKLSALAILGIAAVVAALVAFRPRPEPVEEVLAKELKAPEQLVQEAALMPAVRFTDVTTTSGVDFVHTNGATGGKLLPETMGGGVAFFDYDGDGDPDLLLVNSRHWPGVDAGDTPTTRLYANDGTGSFTDVTAAAGIGVRSYGMGAAIGDYDGDGDPDVFLTAVGANALLRNDGGRFTDVTAAAGVAGADDAWSTSAGFFDADDDGDLDLFVCNYVRWSAAIDTELAFSLNGVDRAYGPPNNFTGTFSYLYRNDGGGSFTDVSAESGIQVANEFSGEPAGKALAVAFVDFDGDTLSDVFIANDTVRNFLFHNQGGMRFAEIGAAAGLAYDGMGNATGAMGADVADYRNEGSLGLAIGNFANETTSLFTSQGGALEFADMADVEGIGSPSRLRLSFGLFFFDYDLDGRLDLLQANGHLEEEINEIQPSQHYRQPAQLFWNAGPDQPSCFVEVSGDEGGDLAEPVVGRGAAYADIDGDGDLDVIVTQTGGRPKLLRNQQAVGHNWLRLRLDGAGANTAGLGSWVELEAGGVRQRRPVTRTKSYLSQVEPHVTFGLGDATAVDALTVVWPDGTRQDVAVTELNRTVTVTQPPKSKLAENRPDGP